MKFPSVRMVTQLQVQVEMEQYFYGMLNWIDT